MQEIDDFLNDFAMINHKISTRLRNVEDLRKGLTRFLLELCIIIMRMCGDAREIAKLHLRSTKTTEFSEEKPRNFDEIFIINTKISQKRQKNRAQFQLFELNKSIFLLCFCDCVFNFLRFILSFLDKCFFFSGLIFFKLEPFLSFFF